MSPPRTYESTLLTSADNALATLTTTSRTPCARLEILEAVASLVGGFDLGRYRSLLRWEYNLSVKETLALAGPIVNHLRAVQIHPALALASLARTPVKETTQKTSGAYYTDFRLAQFIASHITSSPIAPKTLVDPAAGTGILLVACILSACAEDPKQTRNLIADSVCAADLSSEALRGASLALAAMTNDLGALRALQPRLRRFDSLAAGVAGWSDVAPHGFNAVVGNPPWERLKLTRHEFLKAQGDARHYGGASNVKAADLFGLDDERARVAEYAASLGSKFTAQGTGESDLYKAFLELSLSLLEPGGQLSILVPAGLIRSQGTQALRELLALRAPELEFTVFDNRASYFAIDTRFKFLCVRATRRTTSSHTTPALTVCHARGAGTEVQYTSRVKMSWDSLRKARSDLSVPEVRSDQEWDLYQRMVQNGRILGDPNGPWRPRIMREVDMTNDRSHFHEKRHPGDLPVVEGRMLHQFHFGAKRYVAGTGRSAQWEPQALGHGKIVPQFWIPARCAREDAAARAEFPRVGFCDITGQTNERSMLAALVPSGVICGNKVPTVMFTSPQNSSSDLAYLWLAIANSLPFDWLLRRVVTTTVNFFLLLGLPFPELDVQGPLSQRLISLAKSLTHEAASLSPWEIGERRAEIDSLVLSAYGLEPAWAPLILSDFPLLDRGQPALAGEARSTVTADLVCLRSRALAKQMGQDGRALEERVMSARERGAVPYVPAEYVSTVAETLQSKGDKHAEKRKAILLQRNSARRPSQARSEV